MSLVAFFAINFAVAASGAKFKPGAWYASLKKPGWTPPNWAFPVVWTILFCLIAVSGWLVWETPGASPAVALAAYGVSLVLNGAWSMLFFGMKRMGLALIEVVVFWLSIVVVIVLFAPINRAAAALLLPYLAWVGVAGFLNLRLLQLNPKAPAA